MSRKKRRPNIEELLIDLNRSNVEIAAGLRDWQGAIQADARISSTALHSKEARDALAARLEQGAEACMEVLAAADAASQCDELQEQLSGLQALVGIVPGQPGDKLARHLLHGCRLLAGLSSVIGCVSQMCRQCAVWPRSPEVEALLAHLITTTHDVLSVLQDIMEYKYTAATSSTQLTQQRNTQRGGAEAAGTTQVYGREDLGRVMMGQLLELAAMDNSLSRRLYSVRRAAVSALLGLVSRSRRNQQLLKEVHADAYITLMDEVLPHCGDAPTQIDLFEVLYRCSKTFGEPAYHKHLDAHMRGLFAELLAKETAGLDLDDEMHKLTATYNRARQDSSVVHVLVEQLQILTPLGGGVEPVGREVTVGAAHLNLLVDVMDEEKADGSTYEEVCDIEFTTISKVVVSTPSDANQQRRVQLLAADVRCRAFPPSLGRQVMDRAVALVGGGEPYFKLGMLLQPEEADRLIKALAAHDVPVVSQSSTTAEPSQQGRRPPKISMGMAPPSYMRKPLPLTRRATPDTHNKIKPTALFKTPTTAAAPAAAAPAGKADDDLGGDGGGDSNLDDGDADAHTGGAPAGAQQPSNFQRAAGGAPGHITPPALTGLAANTPPAAARRAAATPAAAAEDEDGGAAEQGVPAAAAAAAGAERGGGGVGSVRRVVRDSQMLDALLQTAEQLPHMPSGVRPTLSGSLMAGPSPLHPARNTPAAAAAGGSGGAGLTAAAADTGAGKQTAPAAAVSGAAARTGRQQQQRQQQQQGVGPRSGEGQVSPSREAEEAAGGDDGDGSQPVNLNTLQSNSQDEAELSPAAAVKARRRPQQQQQQQQAAATKPRSKGSSEPGSAATKGAVNAHRQGSAAAAAAAAEAVQAPVAGKPPAGKARRTAAAKTPGLQLERRNSRVHPPLPETQDPIQDPDLPSLPQQQQQKPAAAAAAAQEEPPAEMPAWCAAPSAPPATGHGSSGPPNSKVTTPYSSRHARQQAAAAAGVTKAAAEQPAAASGGRGGEGSGGLAAAAAASGRKRAGRLAKLGVITPPPKGRAQGKPTAAAEKEGHPAAAAAAAAAAAGGNDSYTFPDEDFPAAAGGKTDTAAAADLLSAFPSGAAAAADAAKGGKERGRTRGAPGDKGTTAAAGTAAAAAAAAAVGGGGTGRGRKVTVKGGQAAAKQPEQQQQQQLSGFDFSAGDSDAEGGARDGADSGREAPPAANRARGAAAARGGRAGRAAAAAAKAGKRKAAAAPQPAGKQKQRRKGAAVDVAADAAAGGDIAAGHAAGGAAEGSDVLAGDTVEPEADHDDREAALELNLDTQPEAKDTAAAAAAAAAEGGVRAAAAAAKKGRQQPVKAQHGQEVASPVAKRQRTSRASKSKAMQAMQQQQQLLATQPEQQHEEYDGGEGADGGGGGGGGGSQQLFGDSPDKAAGLPDAFGDALMEDEEYGLGAAGGGFDDVEQQQEKEQEEQEQEEEGDGGDMTRLLTAARTKGLLTAATAQRATEGVTPDTLKIHTAQVVRKLALTGAAGAKGRKQAAAGVGAGRTPNGATPPAARGRKAAAAAGGGGVGRFALAALQLGGPPSDVGGGGGAAGAYGEASPEASDDETGLAAAGAANDLNTRRAAALPPAFDLTLGLGRKPRQGLAAAAAAAASDSDEEDEDDGPAAAGAGGVRFAVPGAGIRQQLRAGGRAAAAAAAAGSADDEDADGFGGYMHGDGDQLDAAIAAQMLTNALLRDDEDEHSDDEDPVVFDALNRALTSFLRRKQTAVQRKRQHRIKELEAAVLRRVAEEQATIKRDYELLGSKGRNELQRLLGVLEDRAAQVREMGLRALQAIDAQWQQYVVVHEQLEGRLKEVHTARDLQVRAHKRKLSALQQELSAQLSAEEAQLDAQERSAAPILTLQRMFTTLRQEARE